MERRLQFDSSSDGGRKASDTYKEASVTAGLKNPTAASNLTADMSSADTEPHGSDLGFWSCCIFYVLCLLAATCFMAPLDIYKLSSEQQTALKCAVITMAVLVPLQLMFFLLRFRYPRRGSADGPHPAEISLTPAPQPIMEAPATAQDRQIRVAAAVRSTEETAPAAQKKAASARPSPTGASAAGIR